MSVPGSSTKLACLAALIVGSAVLQGCRGERAEPAKPVAASAAAAVPAVRSKQAAMAALMALPELKAWSSQLEKQSGGTVRGALIEYDTTPKLIDGKRYWQFSFVENSSASAQPWESFLVAESGDEILVEDLDSDSTLTLAQWRKEKNPMARAGAGVTGG